MADNSSSSSPYVFYHCTNSTVGSLIYAAFFITKVFLLLPLYLLVLYLGHRRWRQHRSFATTSHSDIFTYHSAAMELIYVLEILIYYCAQSFGLSEFMSLGFYATSNLFCGQISFHVLTCVERYLAVVHPVIYLGLRQSGGVRIRNISIGCVWLLYCGWMGVQALYMSGLPYIPIFCTLAWCLVVVSFCSLSVLHVLIRPRPGERGEDKANVDQSKQRAFHTITAITGVLCLFFLGLLVCLAIDKSGVLSYSDGCLVLISSNWFNLPSSLVLPLLFLHRAGKLLCCCCFDLQVQLSYLFSFVAFQLILFLLWVAVFIVEFKFI